ncbi:hypothetical protein R2R35_19990 [Anaerocolumna sp. AGMB13020]|uniref:hypothetical protein n=1 Tax=Anaerocolumna sp. AGMB13020 TaxID=3081750 RepID=UPI0029543C20|nr:hypothetical protein [Anaerocolumna sp. AGMB13020]WOO36054.1 hypothetical protein R2R35_19990 [Anaerocolumna sp. AGMB13020]
MIKFNSDNANFDDVREELNNSVDKAKNIDGSKVDFEDIFNSEFMKAHTNVSNIDDFFAQGKFNFETDDEFEAIPEDELDKYVSANTNFQSWQEMLDAASFDYLDNELGF